MYSNIPTHTHILKPAKDCKHCGAKKFESEPPGFCCRGGKVKLNASDTPDELMRLWSSTDANARHFCDNIRFFNGHFSFTSLYYHLDSATRRGQIYHNIRSFGTEDGKEPRHLELYFYDDDPSLDHWYRKCREEECQKDKEVIQRLVAILRDNPYSQHLRSMGVG